MLSCSNVFSFSLFFPSLPSLLSSISPPTCTFLLSFLNHFFPGPSLSVYLSLLPSILLICLFFLNSSLPDLSLPSGSPFLLFIFSPSFLSSIRSSILPFLTYPFSLLPPPFSLFLLRLSHSRCSNICARCALRRPNRRRCTRSVATVQTTRRSGVKVSSASASATFKAPLRLLCSS